MEWYWVAAMIVGFFGVIALLVYLGTKGVLTRKVVDTIASVLGGLDIAASAVADQTESSAVDVMAMLVTLVNRAVLAAENAFYNDEIEADQRHEVCMAQLDRFLEASEIQITLTQRQAIDGLVAAACEELGHGMVAEKTQNHIGFEMGEEKE